MYLVTMEDIDDGMWLFDPNGFDSEREAREFASKWTAPKGHHVVIYECRLLPDNADVGGTL